MEKIEFIIPTGGDGNKLMGLLYSLINQSDKNWTAHVIADGDYEGFEGVAEHFCICRNIKFSKIEGPHNDCGHTASNYGLKHASQVWVGMTGDDNYYTPDFVSEFLKNSRGNNFLFCNMVHNEAHYKHYQELKAELTVNNIDMGCFASKRENAQQLELNKKSYQADWEFVEKYITLFPGGIRHINKILYVHN